MRREEITYSIHNKPLKENAQTPGPGPRHDWTRSRQHLDQVTFYPVDQVHHIGLPVASGALSLDQVQALKSDLVQTPSGPGPPHHATGSHRLQLAAKSMQLNVSSSDLPLLTAKSLLPAYSNVSLTRTLSDAYPGTKKKSQQPNRAAATRSLCKDSISQYELYLYQY